MNLIQSLARGARSDEQKLEKLLDRREAALAKKEKLHIAEEVWDAAIEDGIVDEQEQNAIRDAMRGAGLERLATRFGNRPSIAGTHLDKLSGDVEESLQKRGLEVEDFDAADRLRMNQLINDVQFKYKAAADVSKLKHATYKAVIDNLKA